MLVTIRKQNGHQWQTARVTVDDLTLEGEGCDEQGWTYRVRIEKETGP
jgi:hypothetical protein